MNCFPIECNASGSGIRCSFDPSIDTGWKKSESTTHCQKGKKCWARPVNCEQEASRSFCAVSLQQLEHISSHLNIKQATFLKYNLLQIYVPGLNAGLKYRYLAAHRVPTKISKLSKRGTADNLLQQKILSLVCNYTNTISTPICARSREEYGFNQES